MQMSCDAPLKCLRKQQAAERQKMTGSCAFVCLQTPWLQVGTTQLLTSEVSVKVADDIEELQQQGIMPRSSFFSPGPSRVGSLMQR